VDEPIYRRLPAFLIATVDKFASLPWVAQSGALLGGVDRYDSTGFYGAAEPGQGKPLPGRLPPPDLVIQDELHLISGPLGTMAGLYETGIEALSIRQIDGHAVRPKIVASTATRWYGHEGEVCGPYFSTVSLLQFLSGFSSLFRLTCSRKRNRTQSAGS